MLQQAPNSPELAPSIFKFEKWLGDRRFADNEEVKSAVDGYFNEFDCPYYKQDIEATEHLWEKCKKS